MWATTQKVKFSLRAAYAELTRNVAIVLGNYNQKNRTIKKTHKETIVEGQSLTLICTCHTCAYAQCLRSTFLTKPLTPPCANQGFAYAKCSYDKALIKTIQNGFWGRLYDKPTNKTKGHVLSLNPVLLSGFGCLDRTHHSGALPRRSSALRSRG